MKRKILFIGLIFLFALSLSVLSFAFFATFSTAPKAFVYGSEAEEGDNQSIIQTKMYAWAYSSWYYYGMSATPKFSYENYCSLKINDDGGTHIDGNGNRVYSNFVDISLDFHTTNGYISKSNQVIRYDMVMHINGAYFGGKEQKLRSMIGKGVIIVSRKNKDGSCEVEEPIWIEDADRLNSLTLTEDGDYHVYIFLLTQDEGDPVGTLTRHVIDYIIPVRSYVYVQDTETDLDLKDSGAFWGPVEVRTMDRNLDLRINGASHHGNVFLTNIGKYHIEVYGNGYLAEEFDFRIFSGQSDTLLLYFTNLKKRVREYMADQEGNEFAVYEAEHNFSTVWSCPYAEKDVSSQYSYNYGEFEDLTSGQVFTEPGFYQIRLIIEPLKRTYQYFVYLVEDDEPAYNLSVLDKDTSHRIYPKWYEVVDAETGSSMCFGSYASALSAALSVENERVTNRGYDYIYDGNVYKGPSEYINALTYNAKKNIKLRYYDYRTIDEKKFSSELVDSTLFLDDNFRFVCLHPSEVNKVFLTNGTNEYEIAFNKPISSYDLPSGVYKVEEIDKYGNKTVYTAIYDKETPVSELSLDDEQTVELGEKYTCRFFKIGNCFDAQDELFVIRVNDLYLTADEYEDYYFTEPGDYEIEVYDRSRNVIKGKVTISDSGKSYKKSVAVDGTIRVKLNDGAKIEKAIKNGKEVTLSQLAFSSEEVTADYLIYIDNGDGTKDAIHLVVPAKDEVRRDDITLPEKEGIIKEELPRWLLLLLAGGVFLAFLIVGGILLIIANSVIKQKGE